MPHICNCFVNNVGRNSKCSGNTCRNDHVLEYVFPVSAVFFVMTVMFLDDVTDTWYTCRSPRAWKGSTKRLGGRVGTAYARSALCSTESERVW